MLALVRDSKLALDRGNRTPPHSGLGLGRARARARAKGPRRDGTQALT